MEWLEFNRWSHEVQQRVSLQVARLNQVCQRLPRTQVTATQAYHLQSLLRRHLPSNPWGHPSAEC